MVFDGLRLLSTTHTCDSGRCGGARGARPLFIFPLVVCRLQCSPWSRRAEFWAAASLAWPSLRTCPLMQFCSWCASMWCTTSLHCPFSCVVNEKCQTFYFVSICFILFRLLLLSQFVFSSFCLLDFLLCQVVRVFWPVVGSVTMFVMVVGCFSECS